MPPQPISITLLSQPPSLKLTISEDSTLLINPDPTTITTIPPLTPILLTSHTYPSHLSPHMRTYLSNYPVLASPNTIDSLTSGIRLPPWTSVPVLTPDTTKLTIHGTPSRLSNLEHDLAQSGGETGSGFILAPADGSWGVDPDNGLPRVVWVSGETKIFPELVVGLKTKVRVVVGVVDVSVMGEEETVMLANAVGMERVVVLGGRSKVLEEGLEERVVFLEGGREERVTVEGREREEDEEEMELEGDLQSGQYL